MIFRNRKLDAIPSLTNDIRTIIQLSSEIGNGKQCSSESEEAGKQNEDNNCRYKSHHMSDVDLNSLPYGSSENEESDQSVTGLITQNTVF